MFPRFFATQKFFKEVTLRLKGFPILFTFDCRRSFLGKRIIQDGIYEEQSLQTIAALLGKGGTLLDIGANYGLYTMIAAHTVGENGRVIAFEPQKALIPYLEKNVTQNGFRNVKIENCALGAEPAILKLYQLNERNDGAATLSCDRMSASFEEVQVFALSTLLNEEGITKVDGIKIDVEGAELSVLNGALPLFQNNPPEFAHIEVCGEHLKRFGTEAKDILDFFWRFNYELYAERKNGWTPFADVAEWNNLHSDNVLAVLRNSEAARTCGAWVK